MKFNDATQKILEELFKQDNLRMHISKIEKLGPKKEIDFALKFLEETDFIKLYREEGPGYELRPLGMVYLDKQKDDTIQQRFNGIIAITAALVALTTIYSFFVSFGLSSDQIGPINVIFIVLVLLCFASIIPFVIDYWKTETFGEFAKKIS